MTSGLLFVPAYPPTQAAKKNRSCNGTSVQLSFNAPSFNSGDAINGTVTIDCKSSFKVQAVNVKIKGFEQLWWQDPEVAGRNKEVKHNKEFFRREITLQTPTEIDAGQHPFTFQYTLPPRLPTTYYEVGGDKVKGDAFECKIVYKVKAIVSSADFDYPVKETTWIIVKEPFDAEQKPDVAEDKSSLDAKATQASLQMQIRLEKSAYLPGETTLTRVKVNSTCKKPIKFLRLTVTKHLDLRSKGVEKRVSQTIYSQYFSGLSERFYGVAWLPFQLPMSLLPSVTVSKALRSHYLVSIECDIPTSNTVLVLSVPLTVRVPDTFFSGSQPQPSQSPVPSIISYRPQWQADNTAKECQECKKNFTVVARRHHCRHCGRLLCANCTTKKVAIPKLKFQNQVRVCSKCYEVAAKGGVKCASAKQHLIEFYKQNPPH